MDLFGSVDTSMRPFIEPPFSCDYVCQATAVALDTLRLCIALQPSPCALQPFPHDVDAKG